MEHFVDLKKSKIFDETSEFECQAMMFCFKTRFKTFKKNEVILKQGDNMEDVILIVKGSATSKNTDYLGDILVMRKINRGEVYGLTSAYAQDEFYRDSVIADEKCLVLFMDKHRLITPCNNKCKKHEIVVKKLMALVAENSINMFNKLMHMSKKTIREKIISYLKELSAKYNSNYFEIPFNKTELANYLSIDRSAMSTELKKMKTEGIIDFEKREFHLIKK